MNDFNIKQLSLMQGTQHAAGHMPADSASQTSLLRLCAFRQHTLQDSKPAHDTVSGRLLQPRKCQEQMSLMSWILACRCKAWTTLRASRCMLTTTAATLASRGSESLSWVHPFLVRAGSGAVALPPGAAQLVVCQPQGCTPIRQRCNSANRLSALSSKPLGSLTTATSCQISLKLMW